MSPQQDEQIEVDEVNNVLCRLNLVDECSSTVNHCLENMVKSLFCNNDLTLLELKLDDLRLDCNRARNAQHNYIFDAEFMNYQLTASQQLNSDPDSKMIPNLSLPLDPMSNKSGTGLINNPGSTGVVTLFGCT